jgi:hypothetical protein
MTPRHIRRAGLEQIEPAGEPVGDRGRARRPHPAGGQLDRQRYAGHQPAASTPAPAGGYGRPGTSTSHSTPSPSRRLEVTSTCTPGARRSSSASAPAASPSCSRLSSTSSSSRPVRWSASSSSGSRGTASDTPSARARSATTRSAASSRWAGLVPTNDTNTTPSGWRSSRAAATSSASRVLPMPPGPTRVTSRHVGSSSRSRRRASSGSRPTSVVSGRGRSGVATAAVRGATVASARVASSGRGVSSPVNPPAPAISSRSATVAADGSAPNSSPST